METLTCRFFDGKTGACMFQKEITKAASPYLEQARSLFRRGFETGDLISALQNLSNIVPSRAKYFDQHAFMEGALDCTASTLVRQRPTEYTASAYQQTCNRFVSTEVIDMEEVIMQSHILTAPQLKLLIPPKEG